MYKFLCAALLLSCVLKECSAFCYYETFEGNCIFLDDDTPQCNQCTTIGDQLVEAIPTGINVVKYTGACGCVVKVFSGFISLLSIINPKLLTNLCTRTKQTLAINIIDNQPCNNCNVINPASAPETLTSAP